MYVYRLHRKIIVHVSTAEGQGHDFMRLAEVCASLNKVSANKASPREAKVDRINSRLKPCDVIPCYRLQKLIVCYFTALS